MIDNCVLTPGRYVRAKEVENDEAFAGKMLYVTKKLEQQFEELVRLEAMIQNNLKGLGISD